MSIDSARAEALAKELDTNIPSNANIYFWTIPILEAMLERIKELEKCLQTLTSSN